MILIPKQIAHWRKQTDDGCTPIMGCQDIENALVTIEAYAAIAQRVAEDDPRPSVGEFATLQQECHYCNTMYKWNGEAFIERHTPDCLHIRARKLWGLE